MAGVRRHRGKCQNSVWGPWRHLTRCPDDSIDDFRLRCLWKLAVPLLRVSSVLSGSRHNAIRYLQGDGSCRVAHLLRLALTPYFKDSAEFLPTSEGLQQRNGESARACLDYFSRVERKDGESAFPFCLPRLRLEWGAII